MRRHAIGVIAIVLLLGAGALWIWPLETTWYVPLQSACSRLGPCMAVLWLAYPEVKRLPAWLLPTIPLLIVILAVKPKLFLIALPIVILMLIIRPKGRQRK